MPEKTVDLTSLTVQVTKPRGQPARRLADQGLRIVPVVEDEGDMERFVISERLAVDRRTRSSFLNGILDKTLFTSAIYLREHFALPVLIVEGSLEDEYRGFDPQAVRGALSSMVLEYGLSVIRTADLDETVQLLIMMIRQEQIGIPEISLIPKRTAKSLPDMQRRVVEMLPGCGRVMARELLQHFGSIGRIVSASVEELRELRGIGLKKAREMQQVLAAEYGAVDTEKQIEDAIETEPALLLPGPVALVARQHHIYDDEHDRHIVDMVFNDAAANATILVELKRGRLESGHREQLRRYLDHARESSVIRRYLDGGSSLRGVLASPEPGKLTSRYDDITIQELDPARIIAVLNRLRRERCARHEPPDPAGSPQPRCRCRLASACPPQSSRR